MTSASGRGRTVRPLGDRAPWLAGAASIVTAGIYGYSAWTKWAYPDAFRRALAGYGLSDPAVTLTAPVVPVAEFALAVALLLLLVWQAWSWLEVGLWVATVGFLAFTALMSWALANGLGQSGCGCFASAEPLNPWDIARDLAFGAIAASGAFLCRVVRNHTPSSTPDDSPESES
ncbi:MAG: hypothetical protein IRZ18_07985 [Clostridia bacterium]|nr:hypothetical protein [Clostridia bacterium]